MLDNGADASGPYGQVDSRGKIPVSELLSAEDRNEVRSQQSAADEVVNAQRDAQSPEVSFDEEVDSFCSRSGAEGGADEWALKVS